jgi:hypothetical protein
MFNNVFMNYYKDFASVRVGGTLLFEDNVFLGGTPIQDEKSDLSASFTNWVTDNLSDAVVDDGNFTTTGSFAWFADDDCNINPSFKGQVLGGGGTARNLAEDYSPASSSVIAAEKFAAGQELVDYVNAAAGKHGAIPFNSPLTGGRQAILASMPAGCLR